MSALLIQLQRTIIRYAARQATTIANTMTVQQIHVSLVMLRIPAKNRYSTFLLLRTIQQAKFTQDVQPAWHYTVKVHLPGTMLTVNVQPAKLQQTAQARFGTEHPALPAREVNHGTEQNALI